MPKRANMEALDGTDDNVEMLDDGKAGEASVFKIGVELLEALDL